MARQPTTHQLYILLGDATAEAHAKQSLKFLELHKRHLNLLAIKIDVKQILPSQLSQRPDFRAALKAAGITRLPAIKTRLRVLLGCAAIEDFYTRLFVESARRDTREEAAIVGSSAEDPLDAYYRKEMTFEKAERQTEDEDDVFGGESSSLQASLKEMQDLRTRRTERPALKPSVLTGSAGKRPPPAAGRAGGAQDEISDLISSLSAPVTAQTLNRAYQGGGEDDLEGGDGGSDAKDLVMQAAYWGNQEHTN